MKKRILTAFIIVVTAVALLTACSEDPLPAGLILDFKAVSTNDSTGVEINSFMLGIADVELETEDENALEVENREENINELIEFKGPYKLNLITGESAPEFGRAIVNQISFREIEIKLGAALDGGNTFFLSYKLDGKEIEVSTEINILEIELLQPQDLMLKRNVLNTLIVRLNQDAVFDALNLSAVLPDTDGVYRINDETYPDITESLKEVLKTSFQAGLDLNKDGEIDGLESADPDSGN